MKEGGSELAAGPGGAVIRENHARQKYAAGEWSGWRGSEKEPGCLAGVLVDLNPDGERWIKSLGFGKAENFNAGEKQGDQRQKCPEDCGERDPVGF